MKKALLKPKFYIVVLMLFAYSGIANAQYTINGIVNSSSLTCSTFTGVPIIYIGNGVTASKLIMDSNLILSNCGLGSVQFIIRRYSVLEFPDKTNNNLDLPAGSSIVIEAGNPGGNIITDGSCSNSDLIQIGGVTIASCQGGGPVQNFSQLVTNGGYNYVNTNVNSICSPASASIAVSVVPTPTASTTYKLYTASSGGAAISTIISSAPPFSEVLQTPIISATTTFYVEATIGLITTPRKEVVVTVNPSPVITTQPSSQLDCEGRIVTFKIVASGSNLTFSWQRKKPTESSFVTIPDPEPNTTYISPSEIKLESVGSAQYPNGTQFQVVVSNSNCSVTSNLAILYVNEITDVISPVLTPSQSILDITLCYGQNYSYTATTSNPSNVISYQWKRSVASGTWTDVNDDTIRFMGAKTATLNITGGTPAESGEYRVYITFKATGANCNTTSSSRKRKITFLPLLTVPQTSIAQPTCILATGTISVIEQSVGDVYSFDSGVNYQASTIKSGIVPGTYNVIIKNKLGCLSPVSINVVIPSIISTWNGGSWSPSAPTVNDKIVFIGNYTASQNLLACSCEVQSGNIVIPSGKTLTLTNELRVTSGALIFEDKASLIQINNVANSGNITYKRTTSPVSNFDYTYWSSPVSPQTLYNVSPNTLGDKFYSFDGVGNKWVQESTSATMAKGTGYIIRGPQSYAAPNLPAEYVASFIGVPNNGTISISITTSGNAFYLLGNPYPSALDADTFILNNPIIEGTLYFWTHNTSIGTNVSNPGSGVYAYSGDDYASYNLTGGAATSIGVKAGSASLPGAINTAIPSGKIGSGQGFFAGTKTLGGVNFTNNMRVGVGTISGDNSQFFKMSSNKTVEVVEKSRIWLNLFNNEGAFKQVLIGYVTGATNEIDSRYDGESFGGNKFVDFYSISNEKKLVIQGRALPFDKEDKVSLGYKTTIEGAFTIAINQLDGLFQAQDVFIEDKELNILHNLKKDPYMFNTAKGVFNNRFILSYISKSITNKEHNLLENAVVVSNKNKEIKIVSSVDSIDSVCIYDIMGKQIYTKFKVDSNQLFIHNLVPGNRILIVEVVLQNGKRSSKKIAY